MRANILRLILVVETQLALGTIFVVPFYELKYTTHFHVNVARSCPVLAPAKHPRAV